MTTQTHLIRHKLLLTNNIATTVKALRCLDEALTYGRLIVRIQRVDPWRNPRQVLDRTLKLFAFVSPLHCRGTHVTPNGGQLTHKHSHAALILQNLTQSPLGQHAPPLQTQTNTTHNVTVNSKSAPPCLRQQEMIHHRPQNALPTKATNKVPSLITKQMLHPRFSRHLSRTFFEKISNAHREVQRKSLHEPTRAIHTGRILTLTWPPIDEPLSHTHRLLFLVDVISGLLHTPSILVRSTVLEACSNGQLMQHLVHDHLRGNALLLTPKASTKMTLQPIKQSRQANGSIHNRLYLIA